VLGKARETRLFQRRIVVIVVVVDAIDVVAACQQAPSQGGANQSGRPVTRMRIRKPFGMIGAFYRRGAGPY
jgi:hypothetical protein